ncbi:MAG: hypothetical protein ACXAEU_10735 [Candidatus Hodarchaeales archaeon]|jgi:hypothetical protein
MIMKRTYQVLSLFVIVILFVNVIGTISLTSDALSRYKEDLPSVDEKYRGWDLPRKIAVIFDNNDALLANTALNVFQSASIIYHNVYLIPVSNWKDLKEAIVDPDYWIKLYFINGKIEGVETTEEIINWQVIANCLKSQVTYHVFGSGATDRLRTLLNVNQTNIRIEGSPVIGAEQSYFYNVWEIGEILAEDSNPAYQRVAEDFRMLGVKYFGENMNSLVNGMVDPDNVLDPLGEEDIEARVKRFDEKMAKMADAYQILPDGSAKRFDDDSIPDPGTAVRFIRDKPGQEPDPFTIADIPLFSGLEGPTAGVIDAILNVLIDKGAQKLGLDPETAIEIINTIKQIAIMFSSSSEGSGDVKTTIKGLLDIVLEHAPIPEKLKPFIPVVVDALYLIRGEPEDIADFAKSILVTIFDVVGGMTNSTAMQKMLDVLESTLLDVPDLILRITSGRQRAAQEGTDFDVMNEVVSFALEKVINFTASSWFAEIFDESNSTLMQNAGELMKLVFPLVKGLVLGDFEDLMAAIPGVIDYLVRKISSFNLSTKQKSAVEVISRLYQVSMIFYDQFGEGSLSYWTTKSNQKLIVGLINASLPLLEVNLAYSNIEVLVTDATAIFNAAAVDQVTDREALKNLITTLFDNHGISASTARSLLLEAIALLGSIWVPSIQIPQASDLLVIGKDLLNIATTNANLSKTTKDVLYVVIDSVFGMIALMSGGAAAQKLLVDEGLQDQSGGKAIQLARMIKDSVVKLIVIYVKEADEKANVTDDQFGITDQLIQNKVDVFAELLITVLQLALSGEGNSVTSFLRTIAMQAGSLFFDQVIGIDGSVTMRIIQNLFTGLVGQNILGGEDFYNKTQTVEDLQYLVEQSLIKKNVSSQTISFAKTGIYFLFNIKDLFTGGVDFIFQQFKAALARYIAELIGKFTAKIEQKIESKPILKAGGKIPFKGADALGIEMTYDLQITLGIEWDNEAFVSWIEDVIFKGLDDFELDVADFFKKLITFITFAPQFSAGLSVKSLSTGKGGLFSAVMAPLGAELEVTGKANFTIQLFEFKNGGFSSEGALKLISWYFGITIRVSRVFTVLDIVTGGASGGATSKAGKYIGLDKISITLWLSVEFEIYKKAATDGQPSQSALVLTLGIGAYITVGINLYIVGIEFKIGLDVYLTFFQDLTPGTSEPFKIILDVVVWVEVIFTFFFMSDTLRFEYRPPLFPFTIIPFPGDPDLEENSHGFDSDNDGLSDGQERESPSLDPYQADTDSDWLGDKFELKVSKTDPSKADSDADGLTDFEEWVVYKTDPLVPDTDIDGLSDFEEVALYRTDPLSRDTDSDGLTDFFEVTHSWNMSTGITPSVNAVRIGDTIYDDHTDPLDPDTDDDLLLDGQEGEFGPYYAEPSNYPSGSDQPILMINNGYTHPLDNDTDDDSYYQYYDGSHADTGLGPVYLRDMRDGIEVAGIPATIVEIDPDGFRELVPKVFQTNPCNPDSDGDTGIDSREAKEGFFLNSDGYELSLDPASDPLDSDTDDDGLIDGLEGTLLPERNVTTFYANPDTDGDGLPDGIEFALGSDPSNPDSDNDLVLDGDEFFRYFTDPQYPDTDLDGVDDYWELFYSHSNPHSADTDGDGLTDYEEIYIVGSDPVDDDSDNDNLSDRDEYLEFGTDPNNPDSDGDGLRDGPEIEVYETNPNSIDSDGDSLLMPDENGEPTFMWTDFQEIAYGSDPKSHDTDKDGILDTWELYIALGDIPNFVNIPLDPLNNDTDNDGIIDGKEFIVERINTLVYPFIGYIAVHPFFSSPVIADTDSDGLGDKYEIDNSMRPDLWDTDNDTLSDWDEIYVHCTDPRNNDTDGDGIIDTLEQTKCTIEGASALDYTPKYSTSAVDPDSDGDGWPDGLEINATDGNPNYDPNNPDVNDNGVLDGYERDFDHDQISDGDEYYTYNTFGEHGGFLDYRNPDSDWDGLMDGDEILVYGTMPFNPDTDYDSFSDSIELWIGTDPLTFTTEEEFLEAVNRLTSPLQVRSPEHGKSYLSGYLFVEMFNLTTLDIDSVYFRYREVTNNQTDTNTSKWSQNISLTYMGYSRWTSSELVFEPGDHVLQVFGLATNYIHPTAPDRPVGDILLMNTVYFKVNETQPFDILTLIPIMIIGAVVISGMGLAAAFVIRRRRSLLIGV